MRVLESHSIGKSLTVPSEDANIICDHYAAVIDGATPKTSFRFPDGETPGHYAARILSEAILQLPYNIDAYTCTRILNEAISSSLGSSFISPSSRPIASVVIYSAFRNEIWQVGDCQWAEVKDGEIITHRNDKLIDSQLSHWRSAILRSMIDRGIISHSQIQKLDPARQIIQPFITRQVQYQNTIGPTLCYGVIDGTNTPDEYIHLYNIMEDVQEIILASDGYPLLSPTLAESEKQLLKVLHEDPLCITLNPQTKGLQCGNISFDDRTFLKIGLS